MASARRPGRKDGAGDERDLGGARGEDVSAVGLFMRLG